MRLLTLSLLLFLLIQDRVQAQKEARTNFDKKVVVADGLRRVKGLLADITQSTACPLRDLGWTTEQFREGGFIEVTNVYTHEKTRLDLEDYLRAINELHCSSAAPYWSERIRFGPLSAAKASWFVKGDTCWLVIPIFQFFHGRARRASRSYADLTVKSVVLIYFYTNGFLTAKIDRIVAVSTRKIS